MYNWRCRSKLIPKLTNSLYVQLLSTLGDAPDQARGTSTNNSVADHNPNRHPITAELHAPPLLKITFGSQPVHELPEVTRLAEERLTMIRKRAEISSESQL